MKWDEWRGDHAGHPVMYIKHLASFHGWKIDLHKMVRADDVECFHTHPAKAIRIILWGGYAEQEFTGKYFKWWKPGNIGIVKPELCHRIALLLKNVSYSLWIRWPKSHEVKLIGRGWPKDAKPFDEIKDSVDF